MPLVLTSLVVQDIIYCLGEWIGLRPEVFSVIVSEQGANLELLTPATSSLELHFEEKVFVIVSLFIAELASYY